MRIGLALPAMLDGLDRRLLLDWARRIEADGYATLGFGERISYRNLELFTVLGAAAAVTERVDIAASVVVLPMHSEVWVAKQMATLDVLSGGGPCSASASGGRAEDYTRSAGPSSGAGTGSTPRWPASAACGTASRPAPGLVPVGPPPVHRIPIVSAGVGPRSLARSAAWADGINGFELDPSSAAALAAAAARTRDAWAAAGRADAPFVMTSWWFALGPDPMRQLHDYARHYLGVFGAGPGRRPRPLVHGRRPRRRAGAVDAAADAGYDEIQLVPTSTDLAQLDELTDAPRDLLLTGRSS